MTNSIKEINTSIHKHFQLNEKNDYNFIIIFIMSDSDSDIDIEPNTIKISDVFYECRNVYRNRNIFKVSSINDYIRKGIICYVANKSLLECIAFLNRHYLTLTYFKCRDHPSYNYYIYNFYSFRHNLKFDNILHRYRTILSAYMCQDDIYYPSLVDMLEDYIESDNRYDSEANTDIE